MTREEYERLLKSDYWKGFSYSLIKERNFTCQDCGRSFYNERNKLQVHHLVYRDIYPWSYRPDELVVLCEECHKRRHGIISDPMTNTDSTTSETRSGYNKTYSYSSDVKDEHSMHSDERQRYNYQNNTNNHRTIYPSPHNNPIRLRHIFFGIFIILFVIYYVSSGPDDKTIDNKENIEKTTIQNIEENSNNDSPSNESINYKEKAPLRKKEKTAKTDKLGKELSHGSNDNKNTLESAQIQEPTITDIKEINVESSQNLETESELSTIELIERDNHADVVKRAERAGVSTEGSTLDILERINHADVVKRAERAGVSTEGSTLDILERINHADVVKRAERAGVSTEGSTMDILERINHADVVKRAERAGVSTEGSTMDILERINHADVVKRAERAGISTEGSTMDILERINHADVVKRAERAGISTEGSTMDILERINHADVVKRAERAGVSTEAQQKK